MYFASDNWAGAHPAIATALADQAAGFAAAYGASDIDKAVARRFSELFERDVAVFYVSTGTAANTLSLASVNRPGGVSFCHREAHLIEDECGAAEYLTGGQRLCPVDGALGRIDPQALEQAIARYPAQFVHAGRPMAVSITQATEIGTVYSLDEIRTISEIAGKHALPMHMDGARFANALVSLDVTPAEMTWKSGIDIVSFGGTKNGCWCAEAVVLLDPARAGEFAFIQKRAAQLFSKSRFVAAQFDAYFRDDLWLQSARHANRLAADLAGHMRRSSHMRLAWEPQANEVFAFLGNDLAARLRNAGAVFYDWHVPSGIDVAPGSDETLCRFVTSFATTEADVERFAQLAG